MPKAMVIIVIDIFKITLFNIKRGKNMRFSEYKKSNNVENVIKLNSLKIYHPPHDKRINLVRDNRSFKDGDGYWQVYPIGFNESQVYIVCPYCGEVHGHGLGKKPDYRYEGHKTSHCAEHKNNGYVIMRQNS
jgi:hypothetical protein